MGPGSGMRALMVVPVCTGRGKETLAVVGWALRHAQSENEGILIWSMSWYAVWAVGPVLRRSNGARSAGAICEHARIVLCLSSVRRHAPASVLKIGRKKEKRDGALSVCLPGSCYGGMGPPEPIRYGDGGGAERCLRNGREDEI